MLQTSVTLRQFELVPYLVAVPQPPADGVADAQTVPVRHDLVVGDSQGRHGAAVRIPETIAVMDRARIRPNTFLLSRKTTPAKPIAK